MTTGFRDAAGEQPVTTRTIAEGKGILLVLVNRGPTDRLGDASAVGGGGAEVGAVGTIEVASAEPAGVIGSDVPWLECPACNALTWVITVTE